MIQSIYNQEILDKIKAIYQIELKKTIGWSDEDIEFLEKQIFPNSLPQAVKDFLLWAGNGFNDFDFRVMSSLYVKDFYRKGPGADYLREAIKKDFSLLENQYIIFFYYIEGDFICFCKLEDNHPNPPVYKTDYELDATDLFKKCAPSFTQFIVDLVLSELKRTERI